MRCRADPSQKLFFRFNCIFGQDFPVDTLYSYVQVEFNVGRRSICTLPQKMADTGLFPFLQVHFAPDIRSISCLACCVHAYDRVMSDDWGPIAVHATLIPLP